MTRICDIDKFMSEWAKPEYSEPWDNDGVMLCGDFKAEVKKALACLEINEKTVNAAVSSGVQLIITHHPFIFHPLKRLFGNEYMLFSQLTSAGISVLSYHTRLDAARGGVNDVLAERLGLCGITPFGNGEFPMGRTGISARPMTVSELSEHIKSVLGCSVLRCSAVAGEAKTINTVAVLGGGGKDFIPDAAKAADAYVTGDLSHNAFITARELGITVFDAGHYYTENPVVGRIAERIAERFPEIAVKTADSECPFTVF